MSAGVIFTPALLTMAGEAPRRRAGAAELDVVPDAALAWDDEGSITYAGPRSGLPAESGDPTRASGAVLPGFVDCHTHLPFVGWRADEFEARLTGETYRDLQGGGGGIFRSSRLLREASDDEVVAFCRPLVDEMLRHGTTALELKTGYGLSVEDELRQARLARALTDVVPQTTTVTLLGCHAVPEHVSRDDWVRDVARTLIPRVAEAGLVDAVDVYVEDIAFTVGDLRTVAAATRARGLALRCHADQLGPSAAAQAAVALGARSADHLNHTDAAGVRSLAGSGTVATLLPVSTLFLRAQPPPVAELMAAGAAVAVASDFNPGTSPCLSMPEVVAVAASLYRMPVAAAIAAATVNPAVALGLDDRLGSLEPGKRADFVVLDAEDPAMIAYRPGHNPVVETWILGRRVHPATSGPQEPPASHG